MSTKILFFSSPWCGPCRTMKSLLNEEIKKELNLEMIDISENIEKSTEFEVMNVPTFIRLENDNEVSRKIGSMTIESLRKFYLGETLND